MDARIAQRRLGRHQLSGFRREVIRRMWRAEVSPEGLWARPTFAFAADDLPDHLRELLVGLDADDPVHARIAQGWIGLSPATNPDYGDILQIVQGILAHCGVSQPLPASGLSFHTTFDAGFFRGPVFGLGSFISLSIGLLQSLDVLNEWVLGASDIHFGAMTHVAALEQAYLDATFHALPFMLGLTADIHGEGGEAAFRAVVMEETPGFDRYARMGHMIAKTQKVWIVLHEVAHWHLGHRRMSGMGSHRQEYEADRQALLWLLDCEAAEGVLENNVPSEVAIPTLFDLLRCAEGLHPFESDTHPTYADRWSRIAETAEVRARWGPIAFDPQIFTYLSREMEARHE
ncbi:hypothetical protein H2509_05205 [Stappia sp. F7233]|uniref:Uncharacterized protein n=1 Tax=Stappia albiluteola TaxID=2758565 RepID=A0A839ACY2_9HYPH|nr:phage exclusion protein Lit family protein [Stappia albiluteola]MBA5776519.1 hypothetical protein [Stappia albiluteola]